MMPSTPFHRSRASVTKAMTRIPDFSSLGLGSALPKLHPPRRRRRALADAGRIAGQGSLWPRGPRRARLPRHLSGRRALSARPLPDHVRQPALDDPPICRVLHGGGVQRLLPPQPAAGPEGPVGRLRSRHPSRLRFRPSARRRAMWAWRASPSIPSTTCARCSPAFRSTG